MLNFYPWGLSVNIVTPLDINRTKVSFIQFMLDETKYDSGAGGMIDKVEREDEFVVEQVSKGLESRYYSMKLNRDKCEVIAMNKDNDIKFENGTKLKHVDKATYLGGILTKKNVDALTEIQNRFSATIHILRSLAFFLEKHQL